MYKLIRPLLFLLDAEKIHHLTFRLLQFTGKLPRFYSLVRYLFTIKDKRLERTFAGLTFRNPVGLAAGFDKDAKAVDQLSAFGFGFIEIGTVTPRPQPGNEKPRLFRLPADRALINRMGFNNDGATAAAERLARRTSRILVGGNIGRNKSTSNEDALTDYVQCFHTLYPYVDYFVVNVSSPNTPGLRQLQEREPLSRLLGEIKRLSLAREIPRPVLLKIAPDLSNEQLDDVVAILRETAADGVIATNTTISRDGLSTPAADVQRIGQGGLSGAPLRQRANDIVKYLRGQLGPNFLIIGCGGIMTADDAVERLRSGANLIQVYTGFVYEGPGFVRRINRRLLSEMGNATPPMRD
jgi:dihydroorotate dehydrogenase